MAMKKNERTFFNLKVFETIFAIILVIGIRDFLLKVMNVGYNAMILFYIIVLVILFIYMASLHKRLKLKLWEP